MGDEHNKAQTGICKIHNVRFYNLSPRSINYIVYNKKSHKLALSRNRTTIEIWNMKCAPYLEKTILGTTRSSIESLAWADTDRLFSTGLTGELIEWDLMTLTAKQKVLMTGNSAWCLDVNSIRNWIAIGTEEGYLNVFDISDDNISYVKIFDKQEGRILCCKFDYTGDFLVTGSLDVIRIWDCKTGHAIYRMNIARVEVKKETIVWSLAILRDFTIISGDSRGRITIWDGKQGTQIDSFLVLKSDILAIAVNDDETTFCCSGIDSIIRMYALTPVKKDNQMVNQWIQFIKRRVHDHDVLALACYGNKIISGGLDGYLGVSFTKKSMSQLIKYGPFLQQPCGVIADHKRLLLLKYFNYLELWQLGTPNDNFELINDDEIAKENHKFLSLDKGIQKLLQLRSTDEEPIVCCSISANAKWLIYSTETRIRVFNLMNIKDNEKLSIDRIKINLPHQFSACTKILFANDSNTIFLAKLDRKIDVFQINGVTDEIDHKETIDLSKFIKDNVHLLIVSKCMKYLICAAHCCTISVWKYNLSVQCWEHYQTLPKYVVPPTAIAIHTNTPKLVVAFPDMKIFEYDLEEMKFTCSTKIKFVPNSDTHAVHNIVLDHRNENIIILHNDTFLFVLEKFKSHQRGPKSKRVNVDDEKSNEILDFKLKYKTKYQHFVHLSWLSHNELVAVGVNPISLIEQLPAVLKEKKFGAA